MARLKASAKQPDQQAETAAGLQLQDSPEILACLSDPLLVLDGEPDAAFPACSEPNSPHDAARTTMHRRSSHRQTGQCFPWS